MAEDMVSALEEEVKLYQEILTLTKEKHQLLKEGEDTTEIDEQKRELRDQIANLDLKFDIKQVDKLNIVNNSDLDKINQFKPTLQKLYSLEKKNRELEG
ncbi:FlgN protein [Halobacteroides halobius DSM 5150]|uniref:FlgN protein n=1 Tax=Halobacteroides halobius (strain ATCC 35273 / DSM 5150 / MD-1) TaxID=748449 RepID=L0K9X0_HALHC|nr:hypothetical protein [Halobacteroides halobius]AGB42112.1 FlgN protein [Halobacteroides halobius DSM 5150]